MAENNTKGSSVLSYIHQLILIIGGLALILLAIISSQSLISNKLSDKIANYHLSSRHNAEILTKEVIKLTVFYNKNISHDKAYYESHSVIQPISRSLHIINEYTSKIVVIHEKYQDPDLNPVLSRLQDHVSKYFATENNSLIFDREKVIAAIDATLLTLDQLNRIHSIKHNQLRTNKRELDSIYLVLILLSLLIAIFIGGFVISKTYIAIKSLLAQQAKTSDNLHHEKERMHTTLESIGDAVITTDNSGLVTYMNPIAEKLTQWNNIDGIGQPLTTVFNIINEETGKPATELVRRVLREGMTVGLANHTVLIDRNGENRAIEDSASPIRDRSGHIEGIVIVFHDVTQAREMAQEMSWQATHDALTGLTNRHRFEEQLEHLITSEGTENHEHAFMYLDLDQFKIVNDTCGHFVGDELLKQVATLLKSQVRENDSVARLGGDEFGILLASCPLERASNIANKVLEAIQEFRFVWQEKVFSIGVSIGLVAITDMGNDKGEVMRAADIACYTAKDIGRNRVHIYEQDDMETSLRRGEMEWVGRINQALEEDRFVLYQQAIVPIAKNQDEDERFEILLRMHDGDNKLISPMVFIPAAERYNLMPAIDRWVVQKAFELLGPNCKRNIDFFSINISGHTLGDDQFLGFVIDELERCSIKPERVCFEITETAAISNFPQAMTFIATLQQKGCLFALDDFGSGLSSFGYLKNLPVNYLKIDGTFIQDMLDDPIDHAMVESINSIGHLMSIKTIAEFVENDEVKNALKKLGVDYGQGFGLSRPEPLLDSVSQKLSLNS